MSWLLNSMQPQISRGFFFLRATKDIWDSAAQIYSQVKNFVRVYQLNQEIMLFHEGEKILGSYFSTLRSMWGELDHYETYQPICQADAISYKEKIERKKNL